MDKTILIKGLTEAAGGAGFITREQLAKYMQYSNAHNVDKYMVGAGRIGKGKFFIPDVAGNIISLQK